MTVLREDVRIGYLQKGHEQCGLLVLPRGKLQSV